MATDGRPVIEVLGPIRVRTADGADASPVGPLQRRLLALLVLHRGRAVSADAAIDVLWPDDVPKDPSAALQSQVSRLRRSLPGAIESFADGYRLEPAAVDVDADLLATAVAEDDVETIGAILERWHGPAYPELDEVDGGRAEAVGLEELRLLAREARARRLVADDPERALVELQVLVADAPLREQPRSLLMAALATAGRHAEALRTYDDLRRRLADELGIDPSPALAAQHAELLVGADLGGWRATTRLPVPAAPLVGRDELVAQVEGLLAEHRTVTLVGPGGVGKTRLAVELGHRLHAERPDRPIVLCELAGADDASAADTVASSLRIDARPGEPTVDRIAEVVGATELLLVLDNCEHVLTPVAELVEHVGARCPGVVVLATSQERLRVSGEHLCTVPPLGQGPAAELFAQRARAVSPGFDLGGSTRAEVAELVARLDGLPLAIELAAARLHTHELAEVAAGLDQRFALLSTGARTSTRHGSLRAAVAWSFGLLDERRQRILAELSCFGSPFTAEAAAAVCGEEPSTIVDDLAQLTEQSLVLRAPGRRWYLLETLRAFGAEQLAAAGATTSVADRHARHQLAWLQDADVRLHHDGSTAIAEIDEAVPELRAALDHFLAAGELELAGRLVTGLQNYGFLRLRPDVLAWAERVVDADDADRSPVAADVWSVASYASWLTGDPAAMWDRATRAVELSRAEGDGKVRSSFAATAYASAALFEGRLDEAARWYRHGAETSPGELRQLINAASEVLALGYAGDELATAAADEVLRRLGDTASPLGSYVWYCAGEVHVRGDVELARSRLTRAIQVAEVTGAAIVTGVAGASRASIDARAGDPLAAAADYRRLLTHWRAAGVWSTQWTMLRSIAVLLGRLERWREAAVLEGAVRATAEGHRIFGDDEAELAALSAHLRAAMGDDAYDAACRDGSVLDGDAAVEHALSSL